MDMLASFKVQQFMNAFVCNTMGRTKIDITEDVLELLAWRKGVRIIYENEHYQLSQKVNLLMAELNIYEPTARYFISLFAQHREEIVNMINTDPFNRTE